MEATVLTLHKGRQFEEEKVKIIKCHFEKNKSIVKSAAQSWRCSSQCDFMCI